MKIAAILCSRLPQSRIVIISNLLSLNESRVNFAGTEFENGDKAGGHSGERFIRRL